MLKGKQKFEELDLIKRKKLKRAIGYRTYIKRRGKWLALGGIGTRGEAIMKGERSALSTLAASFKIAPTSQIVYGMESSRIPDPFRFRGYRIQGAQRIPLQEEWIQKAGTRKEGATAKGARLASFGERMEIKGSRSRKLNFGRKNARRKIEFW